MRIYFLLLITISGYHLNAQLTDTDKQEEALTMVFTTLTLQKPAIIGKADSLIQLGAWEALSYLEEGENLTKNDLQEAVPDYYQFFKTNVLVKLINPKNTNEYGVEARPTYRITATGQIELLKPNVLKPVQTWQIIYLDLNYMALEMAGLRVFFTHTPPQE